MGFQIHTNVIGQSQSIERVLKDVDVSSTKAIFLGKTKPIKQLLARESTSAEKKEEFRKIKRKPLNFVGREASKVILPELEHQGPDPVRQSAVNFPQRRAIETVVNIDGLSIFGSQNDPTGDIGQDYYLQGINVTRVGVFSKEGELMEDFAMNTLWAGLGVNSSGDPIILYDEQNKQWIITEFAQPARLLIAVSETSDPLGSYFAYSFNTPTFPDYPKYAIWTDEIVVTTNEQGAGVLHHYFFERDSLMAGAEDVTMQRVAINGTNGSEQNFIVTTPVDWNGALEPSDDRPMSLRINDSSWGDVAQDQIEIYHFEIDFENQSNTVISNTSIPTAPFDSYPCSSGGGGFACIPQMNGGGLDALPELIVNLPHYRNFGTHESCVLSFVTDATDGDNVAGIRWVELRKTGGADWTLFQEGTFAPDDGLNRFQGSVAIDKNGNIGLAYSVSSSESYAGIRYTGRFATDPLGVMTVPEVVVVEGTGPINSNGFFGDYPQISIDPLDQITFWYTSEYATTNNADTRIVAFRLSKDTFDLSLPSIVAPSAASSINAVQPVTVKVTNSGLTVMSDFEVGYSFESNHIEQVMVPGPLMPDSSMEITFASTVDLSAFGNYDLSTYVVSTADQNPRNDTLNQLTSVLPIYDGSITTFANAVGCTESLNFDINIENGGVEAISTAEIEIRIDGTPYDTVVFTGNIPLGLVGVLPVEIIGLPQGDYEALLTILTINGNADEIPDGNEEVILLEQDDLGGRVVLEFMTDRFPEESAWTIRDKVTNITLKTSGGYSDELTLFNEDICLINNKCYIMTFTDTYNDGICCGQTGNGFFNLYDTDGGLLFESDGLFGAQEQFEFCLGTAACMISAEIDATNPTDPDSTDGVIMITGMNGMGTYNYSIDSGATYQTSGVFDSLGAGVYQVIVQDSNNVDCIYEEEVTLTVNVTSTKFNLAEGASIKILPNPNNGFFRVEVSDFKTDAFLMDVEVRSIDGQLLQVRNMGKYDDVFKGQFSLVDYPDGTYLLRFISKDLHAIAKVIKQK